MTPESIAAAIATLVVALLGGGGIGAILNQYWKKTKDDRAQGVKETKERQRIKHDGESWVVLNQRTLFEELHLKYETLYKKVEKLQEDHRLCEISLATERTLRHESDQRNGERIAELNQRIAALERKG